MSQRAVGVRLNLLVKVEQDVTGTRCQAAQFGPRDAHSSVNQLLVMSRGAQTHMGASLLRQGCKHRAEHEAPKRQFRRLNRAERRHCNLEFKTAWNEI